MILTLISYSILIFLVVGIVGIVCLLMALKVYDLWMDWKILSYTIKEEERLRNG